MHKVECKLRKLNDKLWRMQLVAGRHYLQQELHKVLKAEVRAAQIALEGVQQEALVGSRTVLNVLDAEQELLDAKVDLVKAERDEIVARFDDECSWAVNRSIVETS